MLAVLFCSKLQAGCSVLGQNTAQQPQENMFQVFQTTAGVFQWPTNVVLNVLHFLSLGWIRFLSILDLALGQYIISL